MKFRRHCSYEEEKVVVVVVVVVVVDVVLVVVDVVLAVVVVDYDGVDFEGKSHPRLVLRIA